MSLNNCPQCHKKLAPPFRSTNRQVCANCGWSDKPSTKKTFANDTSNESVNKYSDLHQDNPIDNLQKKVDFSSDSVQKNSKMIVGLLDYARWFLIVTIVIYGSSVEVEFGTGSGLFIMVVGSIFNYLSIELAIVIVKLLARIELNTRQKTE